MLRSLAVLAALIAIPTFAATDYADRSIDDGTRLAPPSGSAIQASPLPSEPDATQAGVYRLLPYVAHATGSWPKAVAIGDVTGDGRNDVLMATGFYVNPENDYHLFVFTQNAVGVLDAPVKHPYGQTAGRVGLVVANLDGQNGLDVAVGANAGITPFFAQPDGTLSPAILTGHAWAGFIVPMTLTDSGYVDLVSSGSPDSASLNRNDGTGIFASTSWVVPDNGLNTMAVGDLDGDGIQDLAGVTGGVQTLSIRLFRNTGNGALVPMQSLTSLCGFVVDGLGVGDVNNDGFNDVVAAAGGNQPAACIQIFYGAASGISETPIVLTSYDIPETVQVVDINQDGRDDVVVVHGGWNRVGIYLQTDAGELATEALYEIPYASHYETQGLAVGDFTGDQCPDVSIADYNNGLVTLQGTNCVGRIFADGFE